MSISFQFGSAFGEGVTKTLKPWAYSTAVRIVSDNGTVARMTDILAPLDKKTSMKLSLEKIANVYTTLADGSVPAAEQSANVTGGTVFAELKTIATKTLSDSSVVQIPMVSRIELRLPYDSDISESDITTLVMATFGLLCDSTGAPVVVTEKLRGALTPVGI